MLAMSICYSANVGGTGTIIGSTPNVAFIEYLEVSENKQSLSPPPPTHPELDLPVFQVFPDNPISFGSYMGFAVPQALICLAIVYFWLQFYFFGFSCGKKKGKYSRIPRYQHRYGAAEGLL